MGGVWKLYFNTLKGVGGLGYEVGESNSTAVILPLCLSRSHFQTGCSLPRSM